MIPAIMNLSGMIYISKSTSESPKSMQLSTQSSKAPTESPFIQSAGIKANARAISASLQYKVARYRDEVAGRKLMSAYRAVTPPLDNALSMCDPPCETVHEASQHRAYDACQCIYVYVI